MQGAVSAIVGIIVAVIVLRIMGNRDILDIWGAMKRKFWKSTVVQEVGEAIDN